MRPRRHSAIFTQKECANVFVESCCAHGAHSIGSAFPPAASQAASEKQPASYFFYEQEVRDPRSGLAVLPPALIR